MAGANSNIQVTNLDFDGIKNNFITYLQGQDTFKDYNFEGSGMSVLLDILAYNTQYNAYYLNMVANEMFLDSAVQRPSVISHAKLLNYIPKSAIAPSAVVSATFTGITTPSLTLPAYSNFISESIDGINYTFVNTDSHTVNVVGGTAVFENIEIKQGVPVQYSFPVESLSNPTAIFTLPDESIDTTTLKVQVQKSSSNTYSEVYNRVENILKVDGSSKVYFLQEGLDNNYEIYFGDGIIGKKLSDGNIVNVSYLSTEGSAAAGANSFVLLDGPNGYSADVVNSIFEASSGSEKETISSIKYQAPKAYASQGRAITQQDYIAAIQQNNLGLSFDAINVWGGEKNDPPVYGQVFVSLKPTGSYNLTTTQKQRITQEVLKPVSVLTVTPNIVDPDYTYIKLNIDVYYNPSKTTQTSAQLQSLITTAVTDFANRTLNTFNSSFNSYELISTIQGINSSIITSDYKIQLQKKFFPNLNNSTKYILDYSCPLQKGILLSGISSSPSMQYRDPNNLANIIGGVYLEEIPSTTNGVESISVLNPGFGYQAVPTVTILGDGEGATAHAVIVNGSISKIVVDSAGSGYTTAIATITPQYGDNTGILGSATVNIEGTYGTLRTYYNNTLQIKTILNSNVGTVDYVNGLVTLNPFNPYQIDNPLGQLTITVNPSTKFISSTYNKIITLDPTDSSAITVNMIAKNE